MNSLISFSSFRFSFLAGRFVYLERGSFDVRKFSLDLDDRGQKFPMNVSRRADDLTAFENASDQRVPPYERNERSGGPSPLPLAIQEPANFQRPDFSDPISLRGITSLARYDFPLYKKVEGLMRAAQKADLKQTFAVLAWVNSNQQWLGRDSENYRDRVIEILHTQVDAVCLAARTGRGNEHFELLNFILEQQRVLGVDFLDFYRKVIAVFNEREGLRPFSGDRKVPWAEHQPQKLRTSAGSAQFAWSEEDTVEENAAREQDPCWDQHILLRFAYEVKKDFALVQEYCETHSSLRSWPKYATMNTDDPQHPRPELLVSSLAARLRQSDLHDSELALRLFQRIPFLDSCEPDFLRYVRDFINASHALVEHPSSLYSPEALRAGTHHTIERLRTQGRAEAGRVVATLDSGPVAQEYVARMTAPPIPVTSPPTSVQTPPASQVQGATPQPATPQGATPQGATLQPATPVVAEKGFFGRLAEKTRNVASQVTSNVREKAKSFWGRARAAMSGGAFQT